MTLQDPPQRTGQANATRAGWVLSLLLHGSFMLGALMFAQRVQLAPQPEPFTWNVAMVSPETAPSTPVTPESSRPPLPAKQTNAPTAVQPTPPVSPAAQPEATRPVPAVTPVPAVPAPQAIAPTPPLTARAAHAIDSGPAPHESVPAPSAEPSRLTPRTETTPAPTPGEQTLSGENPPQMAKSPAAVPAPTQKPPSSPIASQATPTAPPLVDPSPTTSTQSTQIASRAPSASSTPTRPDYGWLSEAISRRVEELKRYPATARIDRAEGKVVVKAVINEDGSVGEIEVFQSSGYPSLDQAALETIRQAAPFHLPHPLGRPRLTIKIPMSYRLDR
ncbi:MAG: TonB family protein [Nitrospirae bacterium]|nr:TonB family protein [Nitrospirota bacterium]